MAATLELNRPAALVAEEGSATLDGGGSVQLIFMESGADVALFNLSLVNGSAAVRACRAFFAPAHAAPHL